MESGIWNLELLESVELESGIWNIWNLESGIWNLESGIFWNLELESGIWNLESGIWNLELSIMESGLNPALGLLRPHLQFRADLEGMARSNRCKCFRNLFSIPDYCAEKFRKRKGGFNAPLGTTVAHAFFREVTVALHEWTAETST